MRRKVISNHLAVFPCEVQPLQFVNAAIGSPKTAANIGECFRFDTIRVCFNFYFFHYYVIRSFYYILRCLCIRCGRSRSVSKDCAVVSVL